MKKSIKKDKNEQLSMQIDAVEKIEKATDESEALSPVQVIKEENSPIEIDQEDVVKVKEIIEMPTDTLTKLPDPKPEIAGLILCRPP